MTPRLQVTANTMVMTWQVTANTMVMTWQMASQRLGTRYVLINNMSVASWRAYPEAHAYVQVNANTRDWSESRNDLKWIIKWNKNQVLVLCSHVCTRYLRSVFYTFITNVTIAIIFFKYLSIDA